MQVIDFKKPRLYFKGSDKKKSSNVFLERSKLMHESTNILMYRWPCEAEAQGRPL